MSAAACARVGEVGRSSASSSRSQWRAGPVPNTLPAPLMTAGTPASSSASRISAAVRLVCDEHGDVAGPDALAESASSPGVDLGVRVQEPDEVGGDVLGDVLARRAGARVAARRSS